MLPVGLCGAKQHLDLRSPNNPVIVKGFSGGRGRGDLFGLYKTLECDKT